MKIARLIFLIPAAISFSLVSCERGKDPEDFVFRSEPETDYRSSPAPDSAGSSERIPPPPVPPAAPSATDYDPLAGQRQNQKSPLTGILGDSDTAALMEQVPALIGLLAGSEKAKEATAKAETLLEELSQHPLAARAPEWIDSILKNDGKLPPEIAKLAPALVENLRQEARREHPEAAAIGELIFQMIREAK